MKIFVSAITLIVVTTLPLNKNVFADDSTQTMEQQFTALRKLNTTYAKCNNVSTGSGITDKVALTELSKTFFSRILTNNKKMVKLVLESEPKAFSFYTELMTADMLATFFMGTNIAGVNETVKEDMESLYKKYDFDWKKTHAQLWDTYECSEIYSAIK